MSVTASRPGPVPVRPESPEIIALFGMPISNVTMAGAVARIGEAIEGGGCHQIATANLDFARNALRDEHLQRVICDCSMVLPDGAPILWASRLLGRPLKERVTGVDLIPELARLSAEKGYRIFFLGSNEKSTADAQRVLEERYPGTQIVGRYSPPVTPLDEMNNDAIFHKIYEARPDILLVAFGNPKQELWIHRFKKTLAVPVLIGIGGSLEMISGTLRRAPSMLQKLQLEWLYRMVQEPKRLLPRYLRDAAALLRHLPVGFAVYKMQSHHQDDGLLKVKCSEMIREVTLPLRLAESVCQALKAEVNNAMFAKQNLLVNMRDVERVNADGLGCLMEARRLLHAQGLTLWLTELSPRMMRVMQYSAVKGLFLIAESTREAARLASLGVPDHGIQLVRKAGRPVRAASTSPASLVWPAYPERRVGS